MQAKGCLLSKGTLPAQTACTTVGVDLLSFWPLCQSAGAFSSIEWVVVDFGCSNGRYLRKAWCCRNVCWSGSVSHCGWFLPYD